MTNRSIVPHRVVLSNGTALLIEEELFADGSESHIQISLEDHKFEGVVDMYICRIEQSGVLVYPNSGHATETLCRQ